jgi:hypothetical protein
MRRIVYARYKAGLRRGKLNSYAADAVHGLETGSTLYLIFWSNPRDCLMSSRSSWYSAKASRVYRPCFSAFLLPRGAPQPSAPPCIRQRLCFGYGLLQPDAKRHVIVNRH